MYVPLKHRDGNTNEYLMFIYQDDTTMDNGGNSIPDDVMVDSRGIPGWEKVAQLAMALLNLRGLSLSNGEAQEIKTLWNSLDPYDKGVTKVLLKSQVQLRGRFCRQKRTGHATVEQMRRYIIFVYS